jgi:hypothetical protein
MKGNMTRKEFVNRNIRFFEKKIINYPIWYHYAPFIESGYDRKFSKLYVLKFIVSLFIKVFKKKSFSYNKVDVVFIDRNRPGGGLFDSTISQLSEKISYAFATFGNSKKKQSIDINNYFHVGFCDLVKLFRASFVFIILKCKTLFCDDRDTKYFFKISNLLIMIRRELCFKYLVEATDPKVIVSNNEILKLNGYPCSLIALQSAVMSPLLTAKETNFYNLFNEFHKHESIYCFLGPEFITKSKHYKSFALGSPKHDDLVNYEFERNLFCEFHKIPKDKKIVFWPTQTHATDMTQKDEHRINAEAVFKYLCSDDSFWLLIKFHPAEEQEWSYEFYNEFKKAYTVDNCTILRSHEADIFDCLAASDVVLCKSSTVIQEAILMKKPVVHFEIIESRDLDYFKKYQTNFFVNEPEKILEEVNNSLNYINTPNYIKEREKYISQNFSNFGFSSYALVELIRDEISL